MRVRYGEKSAHSDAAKGMVHTKEDEIHTYDTVTAASHQVMFRWCDLSHTHHAGQVYE